MGTLSGDDAHGSSAWSSASMRAIALGLLVLASCASETSSPGTRPDAGTSAVACSAAGTSCRDSAEACCNGTTCVFDVADPAASVCADTCLGNDQCASGCCAVLIEGTQAVCAPAKYCITACAAPGRSCATQDCCANAVCVNSTVTGISCAARCAAHSQCVSGCCAPLDNTGELVCSPSTFCR
jgi:hypothetical protein